jgi:hypothetical protein
LYLYYNRRMAEMEHDMDCARKVMGVIVILYACSETSTRYIIDDNPYAITSATDILFLLVSISLRYKLNSSFLNIKSKTTEI